MTLLAGEVFVVSRCGSCVEKKLRRLYRDERSRRMRAEEEVVRLRKRIAELEAKDDTTS